MLTTIFSHTPNPRMYQKEKKRAAAGMIYFHPSIPSDELLAAHCPNKTTHCPNAVAFKIRTNSDSGDSKPKKGT